jgi:hypothetical protein
VTDQGFYVQLIYPAGERWISIAVTVDRRSAIRLGAQAYRLREDRLGRHANGVRVVSVGDLWRDGGDQAVSRADLDVWAQSPPEV